MRVYAKIHEKSPENYRFFCRSFFGFRLELEKCSIVNFKEVFSQHPKYILIFIFKTTITSAKNK